MRVVAICEGKYRSPREIWDYIAGDPPMDRWPLMPGRVIADWFPTYERETAMNIYSMLDRKLKEYGQLVLANNDESVKRAVRDGIPGTGSLIEKHPDDFDVYRLGVFDMDTGVIVAEDVPVLVACVSEILLPKGES